MNSKRGKEYFKIPQFVPGTMLYKENYINLENEAIANSHAANTAQTAHTNLANTNPANTAINSNKQGSHLKKPITQTQTAAKETTTEDAKNIKKGDEVKFIKTAKKVDEVKNVKHPRGKGMKY